MLDARQIHFLTKDGFQPYKDGWRFKFGKEIIYVDNNGYKVLGVDNETLKEIKEFMKSINIKESKNQFLEKDENDEKNLLKKYFKFEQLEEDVFGRDYNDHTVCYDNGNIIFYVNEHNNQKFEERKERWKDRLLKYGINIKNYKEELYE